jgi:hypothetical protein
MSRNEFKVVDIESAYFPVERRPLFVEDETSLDNYSPLKTHFAVMDIEQDHVFSVVTKNYDLVTNKDAVESSRELLSRVFNNIKFDEMQCFNIIMPQTRSFCHIDFIHQKSDFTVWENDSWTPFIRITNSYNKTKLLKYEIGFCRWICKNGMVFGDRSIEFSYAHSKGAKENIAKMADNFGKINKLEKDFISKLKSIKEVVFDKNLIFPLVLKVFDINCDVTNGDLKSRFGRVQRLNQIKTHIEKLAKRYFDECGENGYAALNVLTDFATRPEGVISPTSNINSYQSNCAKWLDEFTKNIKSNSFNLNEYLKDQIKSVSKVEIVINELS